MYKDSYAHLYCAYFAKAVFSTDSYITKVGTGCFLYTQPHFDLNGSWTTWRHVGESYTVLIPILSQYLLSGFLAAMQSDSV